MNQIARNLTDAVDGFFAGKRYLIHDRDPLFTQLRVPVYQQHLQETCVHSLCPFRGVPGVHEREAVISERVAIFRVLRVFFRPEVQAREALSPDSPGRQLGIPSRHRSAVDHR